MGLTANFSQLVGMTLDQAQEILDLKGMKLRFARVDGLPCAIASYPDLNRLNVEVVRDKITRIIGVG